MAGLSPRWIVRSLLAAAAACALAVVLASACGAYTQGDPEFRAFWVDAWGAGCQNQGQVDKLLGVPGDPNSKGDIRNANLNAVIVQVRRRADTNYPSQMGEPYMTGLTPADFNGLQAVINAAHDTTGGKQRIEVHCWMVTFATASAVAGPVYYAHNNPADADNYWPTRDDSGNETSDKAFDPGHPKCEEYTVNVAMDLVNNFDIDGVHFDYIRFTGANQGYNPTSIARYNARYGLTGQPSASDSQFMQWRRDQISAVVRKVYAKIQASKPWVKESGSFVTWNPSPSTSTRAAFQGTRPYYQVYSDWDSWQQEGILDAAVPMTYYNWASLPNDYTRWMNFEKDRKANRHMYVGPSTGMNSLSNAILELQMTRDASPAGNYAHGFSGYSYRVPYSGGVWDDFSPSLVSEVTPTQTTIPIMPWKASPTKGHISGTVTLASSGAWADGATVTLTGPESRSMLCDGTGFYAFIDLTPGTYTVAVSKVGCTDAQRQVVVAIGSVTGNMYVTDFALIAAPIITNVQPTAIGANSATIAWDTDQAANSKVEYGLTTSYGSMTPVNPSYVTSHSVALSSLSANTLYHYRVISANLSGSATSADYTFTTGSYTLTLIPAPTAGGSCTGGGFYVGGDSVSARATANTSYTFASWSTGVNGSGVVSTANPYVFNMPNNNYVLYANFQSGVPDIIIESRSGGLNYAWYGDAGLSSSTAKSSATGCTPAIGSRYGAIGDANYVGMSAHYKPAIVFAGLYEVLATWCTSTNGGSSIKHTVNYRDGQYTKSFNQHSSAGLQNKWNSIGTFAFAAGSSGNCGEVKQYATGIESGKRIMADAAKWVYVGPFKAINPNPADGAGNVTPSNPTLSWTAGGATGSYDVYFGDSEASMVKVSSGQTGTAYSAETLASGATYYWRVDAISLGKTTTGDTWSFTTAVLPTPPVISNVQAINVGQNSATITWATNEAATSRVEYGTSDTYGSSTPTDGSFVTLHAVVLTGLTAKTLYHYRVISANSDGPATSSDYTFTTLGPPIISNLQVTNITSNSATVSWTTDDAATTQVEYGTTPAYGQATTQDANLVTSHSANLTGLSATTVYHLRAKSTNVWALTGYSSDATFATRPAPLTLIVDNPQGSAWGTWTALTDSGGWPTDASQYLYASNTQSLTSGTFTWTPNIPFAGRYNVYCWYRADTDRTTSARYTVAYADGQMLVSIINQALTGGQWVTITTGKQFAAGTTGFVQLTNKTGETDGTKKVIADALKFEYAENDVAAPTVPADLTATVISTSQINLTWSASTDDFGVIGYKVYRDSQVVAITTSPGCSDTNLTSNTQYGYRISAYDASGNESAQSPVVSRYTLAATLTGAYVACDRSANQYYPTPLFTFTNSGFGPGKVTTYRYAWDTSASHTWSGSETLWATSSMIENLPNARPWYFHVKGYNGEGASSGSLDLGPYYYGVACGSIAQAMNHPDATVVLIQVFTPISAVLGTYFYVEELSRTRGIRVDMTTALPVGKYVKVAGTLATVGGERHLVEPIITNSVDGFAPRPVFMRANGMGGKAPDLYTHGLVGAKGVYSIGLLVRVVGKVMSHGSGFFVLADGSGTNVKVYSSQAVSDGAFVGATGVFCVESGACVLQTRTVNDVVGY